MIENDMKKKVKLEVLEISQGTMANNPYLLILRETNGSRKLSVMVGSFEAQSILLCMRGLQAPRPLMHDLYVSTIEAYNIQLREVIIYKVVDGVYHSYLILDQNGYLEQIDTRTSDAIALALRCNAPIYTWEDLIMREHIYEDSNGSISIPISSVNLSVLHEALERAIKEENYELAAQLRDEIERRKGKNAHTTQSPHTP